MKIFNSIVLAILCWSVSATILTDDFIKAYEASNYNETIRLAKISINENDHNFDAWYYKGLSENALYKFTDAVISFERAAELTTDKSAILFLLGNACESSGNSVKAIESYTKLVQLDSLHIQAKARLAKVYKGQKEYLKAIDLFSSLVELDSTNAYFYAQLAFCCKKFGLKDPAIRYYEKVIELNPNDVESGRLLINTYVDQKYYEDAAALVDTLLIRFPNNIQLLKRRAYILAIGGNYIGAIREFQNVVELGDSSMFTSKYYGHSLFNNGL
jgi:tetratricopeptide (TPR) repeat protein